MPIKDFYPEFDFPDRPLRQAAVELSKELLDLSCDKRHGVVIRRPDLHAAGIELGILAMREFAKLKQWAPSPGPPLFLVLTVGFEKACELSGWREEEKGEEGKASPERPNKK